MTIIVYCCFCVYSFRDFEKALEHCQARSHGDDEENAKEAKALKAKVQQAKVSLKRSKRKDLYAIMGVSQNASEDEIKRAYKKKALIYHPDRNGGKTDAEKVSAALLHCTAYDILWCTYAVSHLACLGIE